MNREERMSETAERVASGRVPRHALLSVRRVKLNARCDGCSDPITPEDPAYAVQLQSVSLEFHRECFEVYDQSREIGRVR